MPPPLPYRQTRRLIVLVHTFAAILAMAELALAQEPGRQVDPSSTTSEHRTASALGKFLLGAAAGLGAHEGGHLRWKEPYVGALILIPAVLDLVRFYHPDQRWAAWGSRAAKIGGVALIARQ